MSIAKTTGIVLGIAFASVAGGIVGGTVVERVNAPADKQAQWSSAEEIEASFGGMLGAAAVAGTLGFMAGRRRQPEPKI